MKLRFQQKLLLSSAFAVLVAIVPLTFFLSINFKSWIWEKTEESLLKKLVLLREIAEAKTSLPLDSRAADNLVDRLAKESDIRITLIDKDGKVVGDSEFNGQALSDLENHLKRPEVSDALRTGKGRSVRYSTSAKTEFLYLALPVSIHGNTEAVIRASVPLNEIRQLITRTRHILLAATCVSMLISLMISFIVARRFAYPVHVMTRIAQKIGKQDFSEKIKVTTRDEHADLARVLNEMSTELEKHIEALSRANSQLEATLSSMKEGVLVTNESGEISRLNKAAKEMFQITGHPIGQSGLDAFRNVALHDLIQDVIASGRVHSLEIHLERDRDLFILVNVAPIFQAQRVWGTVSVFHDVTHIRQLERMRREFVANVSHELKTPLTSIKGFTETLLAGDFENPEVVKKNLQIISRQAVQLEALISDVLELGAIESGAIQMNKTEVDIRRLLDDLADEFRQQTVQKQLTVEKRIAADAVRIPADEKWLKRALVNLFSNACNYSDSGKTILFDVKKENSFVQIRIEDKGIGIAESDLTRIFERFYRTDKARARVQGGTGLGLSIVKHIVEAHSGKIEVRSTLGKGTVFTISLPF